MKAAPEGGLYGPLVWSLSACLVVSGAALLILMWATVIGPFLFGALSGDSARKGVGLWVPEAQSRSLSPETTRRLGAWHRVLPEERSVLAVHALERLREQGVGVVVVPDGRSLDPEQVEALQGFVREGGGAILTGAVAVRDAEGGWRGWEAMRRLLAIDAVVPLDAEGSGRLRATRRGPLAARLEPEEEIALIPEPGVPAIADPSAELRWSEAQGEADGASRRLQLGEGRIVWLAAGPESAREGVSDEWLGMYRLVQASLAWVSRTPLFEVLAWPDGASFAGGLVPTREPGAEGLGRVEAEVARAAAAGGLARIPIPQSGVTPRERANWEARARAALLERGGWMASPQALARWRRARDQLRVELRPAGPRRLVVAVTNLAQTPLREVVVRVHLNQPLAAADVGGTVLLQDRASLRFEYGSERVDMRLPELPAGASRSYSLDFELLSEAQAGDGTGLQAGRETADVERKAMHASALATERDRS